MPEDMSVEEAQQKVESVVAVPDQNDATRISHRGRPRTNYDDLPNQVMSLIELRKLVSKRLRRPSVPHKEFMELSRLWKELRGELNPRHARSPNGINLQEIQRREERKKRKALAANEESNHGTE